MAIVSADTCGTFDSFNLKHKPVNNRRNRPPLVMDQTELAKLCSDGKTLLRFEIALKYWHENKSAREIAADLDITVERVKKIIQRLARKARKQEQGITALMGGNAARSQQVRSA